MPRGRSNTNNLSTLPLVGCIRCSTYIEVKNKPRMRKLATKHMTAILTHLYDFHKAWDLALWESFEKVDPSSLEGSGPYTCLDR